MATFGVRSIFEAAGVVRKKLVDIGIPIKLAQIPDIHSI